MTADSSLKTPSGTVLHYGSFLWCRPFLVLSPDTCFVLDDGTGRAIGYCIGVPDTRRFCEDWKHTFLPSINLHRDDPLAVSDQEKKLLKSVFDPESNFSHDLPELLDEYPGHLHIDLLPEAQGRGWGPKMLERLFESLREKGCKGVHLGRVGTNEAAGRFYERIGLGRYPKVLDGGKSGELGRSIGGGVTHVLKL